MTHGKKVAEPCVGRGGQHSSGAWHYQILKDQLHPGVDIAATNRRVFENMWRVAQPLFSERKVYHENTRLGRMHANTGTESGHH